LVIGRKASFEPGAQAFMVEVAADQHQPAFGRPRPPALIQSEPLADEVKHVALLALGDPQHAFGAKHVDRKLLQKALKFVGCEGQLRRE
jgi:hypothetical protein